MALAVIKANLFERRDIRDYTKHTILSAIRANCNRAVELDDKNGGKKNGDYLLAMTGLADAIYAEVGIKGKASKAAPVAPVDIKESDEYKELVVLLGTAQGRSEEQETELEASDEELASLNKDVEDMATKIKTLETANKKLETANKKLTKGAK